MLLAIGLVLTLVLWDDDGGFPCISASGLAERPNKEEAGTSRLVNKYIIPQIKLPCDDHIVQCHIDLCRGICLAREAERII